MFHTVSADDVIHLQVFLFERLNEKCGRELDITIRRWWGNRRNAALTHTEQRLLGRAAVSLAAEFAKTPRFEGICREVIEEGKAFIHHRSQEDLIEENNLFFSQSLSLPNGESVQKSIQIIIDRRSDIQTKKHSFRNLLHIPGEYIGRHKLFDSFFERLLQLLPVLFEDVMQLISKLLTRTESDVIAQSFAIFIQWMFTKRTLDLDREQTFRVVHYLHAESCDGGEAGEMTSEAILLGLPEVWRRCASSSVSAMIISFFSNIDMSSEVMVLISLLDPTHSWFTLWWSVLNIRKEMDYFIESFVKDLLDVIYFQSATIPSTVCHSLDDYTVSLLHLLSTLLVFQTENSSSVEKMISNSLNILFFPQISLILASKGILRFRFYRRLPQERLIEMIYKVIEVVDVPPPSLIRIFRKHLKDVHSVAADSWLDCLYESIIRMPILSKQLPLKLLLQMSERDERFQKYV